MSCNFSASDTFLVNGPTGVTKTTNKISPKYTTEIFHDGLRYRTMTYETNPRHHMLQFNHIDAFEWMTSSSFSKNKITNDKPSDK